MHDLAPHTFWPMLGSGTAVLVHLAVQVVWLVVALTAVRKASVRAATLIGIAVGLQFVLALASPFVTVALGRVVSGSGGMDAYLRASAVWTIVGSVLGAGLSAVLLAGVVRLAHDQRRDVRDPDPGSLAD